MKKIIGILGIAVLAVTMSFNANLVESDNNLDLASLIAFNTANAEIDPNGEVEDVSDCTFNIKICVGVPPAVICYDSEVNGTRTACVSGPGSCWTTGLCF